MAEQQVGHRFLRRRDVVGGVGLGQDLDPRVGLQDRRGALAAVVADRNAGRAVQDEDLALAAQLLDQELGRLLAPCGGIGVDLGGHLVGVDEAVEIDDGDALVAGVGDDAVERGRRAGDQDDGVDIGIDHRLDLLDLRIGVALRVGDDQLVDQTLLLQLLEIRPRSCPGSASSRSAPNRCWPSRSCRAACDRP